MADCRDDDTTNSSDSASGKHPAIVEKYIGVVLAERYEVLELIGSGGWGNVYRARHLLFKKDVAIKIVHRHLIKDAKNYKRFEQEAYALSKIESPYIVKVLDYGLEPEPYIVMEYFDGIPLNEWLKPNGAMPPELAIAMFIQLCEALGAAEACRIVHRDLKPSNILLRLNADELHSKILDFGVAKVIDPETPQEALTATGEVFGSPAFMSPEQWKGLSDHRSDIYSLGCIMYEVLTGQPVFTGQNGLEFMAKHLSKNPLQLSQANSQTKYPAGLEDVVLKCIQKEPENRYQSGLACRDDLLRLQKGSKPSISLVEKIKRKKKRNMVALGVGLSSAVAVVLWNQSEIVEYQDSGVRGNYFPLKSYIASPLPTFENCKDKLPKPILEDDPQYVELYWKAWQLAFQHLRTPPAGSPLVSNFIEPAYGPSIFQWDTAFMMMFTRYGYHLFPFVESLDNFYARQYENGYICWQSQVFDGGDIVEKGRIHSVNPPLFAWAETEYARISGDQSRYAKVLPVLMKHTEWLEKYRRKTGTAHGLYWNTANGSGMNVSPSDNRSPRGGSGWVDMSVQMLLTYQGMDEMAQQLKQTEAAAQYRKKAQEISASINKYMWNDRDGLYYDVDDQGKQLPCKTIACFWPMLAGICNEQQVSSLMNNLKDEKSFWRHNVFPSMAADQPGYRPDESYWMGGVWASSNVMIIKGLDNYPAAKGEGNFSVEAVRRYLDSMCAVYKSTGTIWQCYSAEHDAYANWSKPDYVGWSGLGPIELLLEDVVGIQADALAKRITWRLARTDRHGIENYNFGAITTSLVASRRKTIDSPIDISVSSNKPFELRITGKKEMTFQVTPGHHVYRLN